MRHRTRIAIVAVMLLCGISLRAQYNRDYFFMMGRTFMLNNDYRAAIRTLNTLLRFDPDAYEGYFLRGIAKYNLDDILGAEADFTVAIDKNPVYTTAYTYRAMTRFRMGNYEDALDDFREAIDLRPDIPNPYYTRGVTRLMSQQFEEALEDFDTFIKYEKKVADAYINRGICYLYLKDTVRAYSEFETAIRTNRESPNGYNRRGTLYMQQNRYAEAEADFDKAVQCDTTYLLSYFNRALLYSYTHRPMQAIADLNHVIASDSTLSLAYYNRAILRSQIGDYNRALEDYDIVARYSPDNVLVYYNRGALYARLGEYERAVENFTRAIELYPDFANAYLNRSYLRAALHDTKGARADKAAADKKIAAYKARLADSTYSIYADTTQQFDRLLSFDSKLSNSANFERITTRRTDRSALTLLPLYKFTLIDPATDTLHTETASTQYYSKREADFKVRLGEPMLVLSCRETNVPTDVLLQKSRSSAAPADGWEQLFLHGVTLSLARQYTSAVNAYTAAVDANPSNPFLYINRSATRAEMIDFISSIDNSYQRITIDSDPAAALNSSATRTYDYDEAIADLNKAQKLYPDFAYIYYNRANLLALSGKLPEAYDDYTRAVELNPQFAEAYYNRGLIQIFMKDTHKGCLDMSKAGELGLQDAYGIIKLYSEIQ